MTKKSKWYDVQPEGGVEIASDPAEDAKRATERRTTPEGITRLGGGDHGKTEKGVKVIRGS